ncbi:hypothetical protein XU18_0832 [Perkinsela sp. CCAP 1560/4]|nr:hypothetical protein XU18_0832 [Perkinsela sp. CCAP 1560/4]|eukprot:KNH08712.1 hypothetical protein XU18_0832 [Perkinsela sp. CCAP 1560/4]
MSRSLISPVALTLLSMAIVHELCPPICMVQAQVVGIDLGSEFIKIASVRRSDGIDIVLNEETRRKTPHYVGFRGKDSYIGEDAKNLVGRFPDMIFTLLNRLIGLSPTESLRQWYHSDMLFTNALLPIPERESMAFSVQRGAKAVNIRYAIETLLGMTFEYVRSITASYVGEGCSKQDAVLTVPHFFDMHQRRALFQSAALGNTNVIATIHTTTAIALQYGVQNRGFGSMTKNVLILDMGASKTEVGIYTFTPAADGAKRSESLGTLTTRAIVTDPFFGGRIFDVAIAKMIAEDFHKKTGIAVLGDTGSLDGRKGIAVLMRSANRAKEVLSSNKECPVTVEGITKGRDHSTIVRRADFEAHCASLFAKVSTLVKSAIDQSGLDLSEIHAVEVHGGAIRIPKLLDVLAEELGQPIQRTLNGDEAAVLGAAFHAARVSGTFGVKGFAIQETIPYNITFSISPKASDKGLGTTEDAPVKSRGLFANASWPAKKSVSVNRTENFEMTFSDQNGPLQVLKVSGLHDSLEKLGHFSPERDPQNSCSVRIEAKLDGNGVLSASSVKLKYNEWKVKSSESDESSSTEVSEEISEPIKHDISLPMEWEYIGRRPLSTTEFESEKLLLKEQEAYEASKRAIAQARNDLETLIIGYEGDALEALQESVGISIEQTNVLLATISEVKEWLYDGDGVSDSASVDSFRSRQQEILTIVEGIRYANINGSDDVDDPTNEDSVAGEGDENAPNDPEEL